jgi:hypothetical protein
MRIYVNKREAFVLSTALLCLKTHYPNTMGAEAQQLIDKINLSIQLQKSGKGAQLVK